jgi:hypothetical protein
MSDHAAGQVVEGLWQFEALHPEWTLEEGGEDGWGQLVAWWAVAAEGGIVLVDPLVDDWEALDRLVAGRGGCAGIVRTCHWHQRSIAEVASRYGAEVWAKRHPDADAPYALDHEVRDRDWLFDRVRILDVERADEIALWLPQQVALVFGDAMLRPDSGELRVCPESWLQPPGGAVRLRALLNTLTELAPEHVLVSHGPLVLGDGVESLRAATG